MNLISLIESSGKTQAAVARAIGTRPQYMNAVIKGRRPFPISWVQPLCEVLSCDPNELFGWSKVNRYLAGDIAKLTVLDIETGKEIAVVTSELITTAGDNIVVKLTPEYD